MSAKLLVAAFIVFAAVQAIRPGIPVKSASAEIVAPPQVKQILEKDCYSCHSNERRLSWFDQIQPAYSLVRYDILRARQHLNFSTLGEKPPAVQKATLFEAVNMIQLGAMPLHRFTSLHPDAKVTPEELEILKAYLAPWPASTSEGAVSGKGDVAQKNGNIAPVLSRISLTSVHPEWNGVALDPDFENWHSISTTERGDNNTFRLILGNDIAVKAIQAGSISPWPDGARIAKLAWQRTPGPDGMLHPGKFVQVEMMVKDAGAYRKTDGWGWARWRGLDLKPYGTESGFVKECTNCHEPVRGNDFVYTLPLSSAAATHAEVVNSRAAALPQSLPWQPLAWGAITLEVNPKTRETATLFGNDVAMKAVRSATSPVNGQTIPYPAGSVLALVTWAQRDDPHWFGARIPDVPRSVEFVEVGADGHSNRYRRFAGSQLTDIATDNTAATNRAKYVLDLPPVQLP